MFKFYNTQEDFASSISNFLKIIFPNIRKTQLNIIPYIMLGMILSESSVTSDIAKSLKNDFSNVLFDSVCRRIRRFFNNKFFDPYSFYQSIISFVIKNYKLKHSDKKIHIIFDHMFSKENYVTLMFSLRIGTQSIPLWFKCFYYGENKAFHYSSIIEGIDFVFNLFKDYDYKLIFLADRWFNSKKIIDHLISLNLSFYIRCKRNINTSIFVKKENHYINMYISNLFSYQYHSNFIYDAYLYSDYFTKVNICIGKSHNISDCYYIITNSDPTKAIKEYNYRFGGIECLFKNQKSNGFYLEAVCNASLKAYSSMYSLLCFSTLFLTILGTEYSKNSNCYKKVKITTHKVIKGVKVRVLSLFNTGLTLFHLAFNSHKYIRIPFKFILYDI